MGKGACGAVDRGGLKRSLFGSVKDLSREFYTSYVNGTVTTANADARGGKLEKKKDRVMVGEKTQFTWEEVEQHNTTDDCWIVIKGNVYDVTDFAPMHPGGRAIYTMGGRDGTDVFAAFHEGATWSKLKEYRVGSILEPEAKETALIQDFRKLRATLVKEGLFKTSYVYYVWKLISTTMLAVASGMVLKAYPEGMLGFLASAALVALFWQQSGWLSHDFCHNQVFKNRKVNHVLGMLTGNVYQGFSVAWWKNKHNTHHAVPNELDGDEAQDPDIDTLPFFAWDEAQLANVSPSVRSLLRIQHVLLFPFLSIARISWASQSFLYALEIKEPKLMMIETTGILVHYTWMFSIPYLAGYSVAGMLGFMLVAQMISGVLLSFVFVQSHNAMEVYQDVKDFATAQLVSTRNIHFGPINDWFAGGLNLQIEHHLFPTMPRHQLRKAAKYVEPFCAKHGIAYECVGWCEGTAKVVARLKEIAALA